MKILEVTENNILIETEDGKFKYQKTTSGYLPKDKGYRIRVWSYQLGNWLSKKEIKVLDLPDLESFFESE